MASFNQNASYGRAMLDAIHAKVPAFGKILVVANSADTTTSHYQIIQELFANDSNGKVRFFTSLASAYAAAESDNNDVIVIDGATSNYLTAGIAWTKNRINVIGFDGGNHLVQQGSKIEITGAIDTPYVIKVTGVRNSFENIKFIQSSTHANALTVVQDGGEGTVYKNCSFVFGVANNLGGTTAHEFLAGSDSATFEDCLFGSDTLLTSGARSVFHMKAVTAGQEFKSNILRGCTFIISSSSATASFVRLDAVSDILFTNLFDRCSFIASVDSAGGIALTAGAVQTGTGTVKGGVYLAYPSVFNC